MSEDQKQPQQPKGIGMVDLINMYSINKPSIDKSFAEFMTAMRPMFKGLPDFTDVKISDMKYSNKQAWDHDDINTLFGLVLEAEIVRFDLIDARVDHMNEANWKTLDDLIEKKKLVVPGNLKLNKICWQRIVARLNRDKKSDEDASDLKKDSKDVEELKKKCDELEIKCKEIEENYAASEARYNFLQDKYDVLEKKYKDLVDSLKPFKKQAASLIAAFKPATDST